MYKIFKQIWCVPSWWFSFWKRNYGIQYLNLINLKIVYIGTCILVVNKEKGQNHRYLFTDFFSRGYEDSISANSWLCITWANNLKVEYVYRNSVMWRRVITSRYLVMLVFLSAGTFEGKNSKAWFILCMLIYKYV